MVIFWDSANLETIWSSDVLFKWFPCLITTTVTGNLAAACCSDVDPLLHAGKVSIRYA